MNTILKIIPLSLLTFAVSCTRNLDTSKIEEVLKKDLKEKKVEVKKITCPAPRPLKKGDEFECTIKTEDDDEDVTIKIEQTDATGSYKWELNGRISKSTELSDELESILAEKGGKGITVTCPKKTYLLYKGKKITCKAEKNGETKKVDLSFTSNKGKFNWKLQE